MESIRTVIVDDSPFSIAVIKSILIENGHEVVGTASSLEEVKQVVSEVKPAMVTMDMTMPGTNGLECTRAIHQIDKNVRVIMVSAMMDDEIIEEARKNGIGAYVQKPIEAEDLLAAIEKAMAADELYQFLQQEYMVVFSNALKESFNKLTRSILTYEKFHIVNTSFASLGADVVVGIAGKFSGEMILSLSMETSGNIAEAILKSKPKTEDEITLLLSEFGNIVAGNACSLLNQKDKMFGLRVVPPSVIYGDSVFMKPTGYEMKVLNAKTIYGDISLYAGFKGGA